MVKLEQIRPVQLCTHDVSSLQCSNAKDSFALKAGLEVGQFPAGDKQRNVVRSLT